MEMDKLQMGKTTLKSIFKSKSSKETEIINLTMGIEGAKKDVEDYRNLVNFLSIYHGQVAI